MIRNTIANWSSRSKILGIGILYLTVILLIARLSIQSHQDPSFLGAKRVRTAQGLKLLYLLLSNTFGMILEELGILKGSFYNGVSVVKKILE